MNNPTWIDHPPVPEFNLPYKVFRQMRHDLFSRICHLTDEEKANGIKMLGLVYLNSADHWHPLHVRRAILTIQLASMA